MATDEPKRFYFVLTIGPLTDAAYGRLVWPLMRVLVGLLQLPVRVSVSYREEDITEEKRP